MKCVENVAKNLNVFFFLQQNNRETPNKKTIIIIMQLENTS